ncbi:GNAT family N-acetyltransferase [Paenibacillaceae bacterium WGS1546]|uniref:GNAT family N-acetyltransferase n=1 Tax=Cohnella sp. WGS1546 TaxID=3366810 RepID=UPI00372D4F54
MRKKLQAGDGRTMRPLTIRNYERRDFAKLVELQRRCFPPPFPSELWWNEEQLNEHVSRFPDGALCAEAEGRIVGSMTGLRTVLDDGKPHTWSAVTDEGYIRTHLPNGDTIYVVDLCVDPEFRQLGIGKWLMQSMYETVVYLGCRRLLGGGRMPGYAAHADKLSPEEYVARVVSGELRDPVLTFMLRCGRMPIGVVPGYLEDEQSAGYAALMEWKNPFMVEV